MRWDPAAACTDCFVANGGTIVSVESIGCSASFPNFPHILLTAVSNDSGICRSYLPDRFQPWEFVGGFLLGVRPKTAEIL